MSEKLLLRIGRAPENDLVINQDDIGNLHLELFRDATGNVFITDMESPFGTYVNNKRLKGYTLLGMGDEVRLGDTYILKWEKYAMEPVSTPRVTPPSRPSQKQTVRPAQKTQSKQKVQDSKNETTTNKQLIIIYGVLLFLMILMYLFN
jgi:pSer/pThr/pTyr-binding forkhead associated (FHA) protein